MTGLFVKCLTTLPNLHTLKVVSMWDRKLVKVLVTALRKEKPQLQRVRTLVLPTAAHQLLRYCPNVEDLTCCNAPDGNFVETLVASGLNHLTKFSAMYVQSMGSSWWSAACFASRSLATRWAHENSHRDGGGLSGDS